MAFMDEELDGSLRGMMARFPRAGRLEWIGLRPRYRIPVLAVQAAEALAERGLAGDRFTEGGPQGN